MTTSQDTPQDVQAAVTQWQERILQAKDRWKADFERMRSDMKFAAGLQWEGQTDLHDQRYVVNLTNRAVNQKVASLYARNPKAIARMRQRLDFELWDEKYESVIGAIQTALMDDISAQATINDYEMGKQFQKMLNKVARTTEIVYQYEIDRQEPEFKLSMKQLVRRVVICGVGYARVDFVRANSDAMSTFKEQPDQTTLTKRINELAARIEKGEMKQEDADPELDEMRVMLQSLQSGPDAYLDERLVFDFPPATSIIPDRQCRSLKGFVGARWIAQEFIMPLTEVNAFFGTEIEPGGELVLCDEQLSGDYALAHPEYDKKLPQANLVRWWEVWDKQTKSTFCIVEGWKDYVKKPETMWPEISRFWPIFSLTFNDTEYESSKDNSIFPPSDVTLARHPQMEWNRTRNELKDHRKANRPKYMTGAGWLTDDDKNKIIDCESNVVIELNGLPPNSNLTQLLAPFVHAPVDPALYNTEMLMQDILLAIGLQEANIGPTGRGTATEATIAEQSRLTVTGSNADDLDDFLSDMAKAGGEILLREMSVATVKRIAGRGAVWPMVEKDDFLNEIFLEVLAASSGRPNRGMDIAFLEKVLPLLLQAGANPHFLVREGIKRWDDRLDATEAFPLVPPMAPSAKTPQQTPPLEAVGGPPIPLSEAGEGGA